MQASASRPRHFSIKGAAAQSCRFWRRRLQCCLLAARPYAISARVSEQRVVVALDTQNTPSPSSPVATPLTSVFAVQLSCVLGIQPDSPWNTILTLVRNPL